MKKIKAVIITPKILEEIDEVIHREYVIKRSRMKETVPYRVYTKAEIDEFMKEDKLSEEFVKKLRHHLSSRSNQ